MIFNNLNHLLFIGLFIIAGCEKKENPFLKPNIPARYSITIGTEAIDRPMNTETFERVCGDLQQHAESAGIVCQSITKDAQKQQITFNVIGLQQAEKDKNYGINYYSNTLISSAKLEFYDVYRNDEKPVIDLFTTLYDKYNLSGKVNINLVNAEFPNGYPAASPCSVTAGNLEFMDSILRLPQINTLLPDDMSLVWSLNPVMNPDGDPLYELFTIKEVSGGAPFLTGRDLESVSLSPGNAHEPAISIIFKPEAARIWANKTRAAAIDRNRPIAILLDDRAVTVPNVMSEITGGQAAISGGFTMEETVSLVNRLKISALPCTLKIVEAKKL